LRLDLKGYSGFTPVDVAGLKVERNLSTVLKNVTDKQLARHHARFNKTFSGTKKREAATVSRQKTAREQRAMRNRRRV
jgi:hypothetical protein